MVRRIASILVLLAAVVAVVSGDAGGAAANYPTPLELRSTASAVTGTWKLDTGTGTVDATTRTTVAQSATGWYAFDPGTTVTTQLASLPTTTDGKGWMIDPAGGATGFPAGDWVFTVKTDVPDSALVAGAAVLTVGIWKGTFSGGAFTATGTILTPTDDPLAQNLRSSANNVTTTVTYTLPKFAIGAGETLFVDFWRHQTAGIDDAGADQLSLDFLVNDGVSQIAHPVADSTGPTHSLAVTEVTGNTHFDSGSGTVYYDGSGAGSFTVSDTITDTGAGPYSVTYPLVSTAGWTHAAQTVTAGPSYTSSAYSWTAGSTTSPGAQTITGEDLAVQQSTTTLTITNDSTAPSGQSVTLSGGPGYSTLSVPLTLVAATDSGSGLDSGATVVQRSTATMTSGTCGSFGSFSAVTLSSGADTTVTSGNCYRYRYRFADNVGNASNSSHSADAKVDTSAPTVTIAAPTEVSGAGDQHYVSTSDTLFFRPAATGSFTLTAAPVDAQSGIASVAFQNIAATSGWTGSTGGTDTESPYASPTAYTWTAGATSPTTIQATATNGTGLTGADTITVATDATAPSGGSVTLSGGPYYTSGSVALTLIPGTDNSGGSGIDSARGVERASATLTNGVCGTFGAFAPVTLAGGADTSVQAGNCYRYQYKATDNVGNVATTASAASSDAKVDTSPPTGPTLTFSSLTNVGVTGTTVFYKPGTSGTFTLTVSGGDTQSGSASFSFPSIPGWTSSGTGASRTYSFTGSPPEAVDQSVSVTNGAGLVSGATFSLRSDATAPTLTILCNGALCLATPYKNAVSVTMTSSDTGSGPAEIRYTTNGATPTPEAGNEYQSALTLTANTVLKVRAYDRVGNATALVTRTIVIGVPLTLATPLRLAAKMGARQLQARVRSSTKATVVASLKGPGLKKPLTWRFNLRVGTSIVQLRLLRRPTKPGRYTLTWSAKAAGKTTRKVTRVDLKR